MRTMKLEQIWDKQEIAEHIMNSFNEDISYTDAIPQMEQNEANSIQMILYQKCHTLRKCYLDYDDADIDDAKTDLKEIISHNAIQLVMEVRMLVKSFDFEKVGKGHSQNVTRPFNNEDSANPDNIITDTIVYTDLGSMINTIEFVKKNSTYTQMIYREISNMVQMIY